MIGQKLAAPHAIDLECASSLRGLVNGRKLPADEAERALELLGKMNVKRYGHSALLPRIWQLRNNMWPYDAAYVALAEALAANLSRSTPSLRRHRGSAAKSCGLDSRSRVPDPRRLSVGTHATQSHPE